MQLQMSSCPARGGVEYRGRRGWEAALDSYSCPHTEPKLANCQSELLSWFAYYAKVFVRSFVCSFGGSLHRCLLRWVSSSGCFVRSWVIKTLKDASVRDKSCFSLSTWRVAAGRAERTDVLGVAGQVEPSAVVRQTKQISLVLPAHCLSCHSMLSSKVFPGSL